MTIHRGTFQRVVELAAKCGWCGGKPRVEVYPQMADDGMIFQYYCRHAPGEPDHFVMTVDMGSIVYARDPVSFIKDSGLLDPFPLAATLRDVVHAVIEDKPERRL